MTPIQNKEEILYRAVRPGNVYWTSDGHLSSAAFKCRSYEKDISVDRKYGRCERDAVSFLLSHLTGSVVSVTVADVDSCNANAFFTPSKNNPYHSSIQRLSGGLTAGQSKKLADAATIIFRDNK